MVCWAIHRQKPVYEAKTGSCRTKYHTRGIGAPDGAQATKQDDYGPQRGQNQCLVRGRTGHTKINKRGKWPIRSGSCGGPKWQKRGQITIQTPGATTIYTHPWCQALMAEVQGDVRPILALLLINDIEPEEAGRSHAGIWSFRLITDSK